MERSVPRRKYSINRCRGKEEGEKTQVRKQIKSTKRSNQTKIAERAERREKERLKNTG